MNEKKFVEVIIDGTVHKLISDEKPDQIERIARYINGVIDDIRKAGSVPTINSQQNYLRLTINIVNDHLKALDKITYLENELDTNFKHTNIIESENHLLKQKIKILQDEIDKAKKDLDEYINTFDNKKNNKK